MAWIPLRVQARPVSRRLVAAGVIVWAETAGAMPRVLRRFAAAIKRSRSGRCDVDFAADKIADLNCLAGWATPEWALNRSTDVPGAARRWIAQTKLQEQVCLYDRAGRRWSLFQ